MNKEFSPVVVELSEIEVLKNHVRNLEERIAILERLPRHVNPIQQFPGAPIWNPQPYQPMWVTTATGLTDK